MRIASSRRRVPSPSALAVYSGVSNETCTCDWRREIEDLVWLRFLHDTDNIGRVGYITIMQLEGNALLVRVVDEMVDALGVERRRTTLHAVDDISLGEKKFGQIGAILPGCAGDEGYFA